MLGVSVWPEEYGICIESTHFSLGLRVWDRRFLHASGCLRYRVSLLVFWVFFYCSTCEVEYMSDFFVCSALAVPGDFWSTFHSFYMRGGSLSLVEWLCDA